MSEWRNNPAVQADIDYLREQIDETSVELGAPPEKILTEDFQLACDLGAIKAEATMWYRRGVGHINLLTVFPQFRRQGNGRELLSMIETFARAHGLHCIKAETTEFECSKLYEHCGFREIDRQPTTVTINGVSQFEMIYKKELA